MTNTTVTLDCFQCVCVLTVSGGGYTETSVRGGRDERGVRRQLVVTREGGHGCYLLGMAPQLLQPLPGLTVENKQLVPLCCVRVARSTEIITSQCITSTFQTRTRPSSPAEAHLGNIR